MTDSSRYLSDKCNSLSPLVNETQAKMKMTQLSMPEPVFGGRDFARGVANEAHYWRDNTAANDGHDDKRRAVLSVPSQIFDTQREDGRVLD